MAMRKSVQMFLYQLCFKNDVSFWNKIWLCEKPQTLCNCFHSYSLREDGFAVDNDNLDITDGSSAGQRRII